MCIFETGKCVCNRVSAGVHEMYMGMYKEKVVESIHGGQSDRKSGRKERKEGRQYVSIELG